MIITIKQNNKSSNLHYVRKGRTQNVRLEEAKREIDGRKKKEWQSVTVRELYFLDNILN